RTNTMHLDVLTQIAIAIVAATLFGFVMRLLKQPLILGYILAGVVVGQTEGLGWIDAHTVEPIAHLGLILLLFMIGLEIDLKKIRRSGSAVALTGTLQFVICVVLGLLIMPLLGFTSGGGRFDALYMAVAAALSSTMIVVKILYDKDELDTLPGQITLGVLVFQDLWAILFLAVQPNLQDPRIAIVIASLAKVVAVVAFALLVSRYILPRVFRSMAELPELLVIGALGWCFLIVLISAQLGLSREMGALVAGISLSTFPYNLDVIAKVISLRDFFITLFFVTLGTQIARPTPALIGTALIVAGFIVVSRLLSISPLLHALRYGNRVSVIPAINLAQISEFSLVIGTLGVQLGHIGAEVMSVIVLTLVATSVLSTYGLLYNYEIFNAIRPVLKRVGLRDLDDEKTHGAEAVPHRDILFMGFHRHASSVLFELLRINHAFSHRIGVVDFNPETKHELDRRGIPAIYGDISHFDTLHHADIHDAEVIICTLPDTILKGTTNLRLLRQIKAIAPRARIIMCSDRLDHARELYDEGAAYVFVPRLTNARELARIIETAVLADTEAERTQALQELSEREEVLV
ncbi:MAG: cation:proton antiporter, partial [Gemmatimonadota bacterium]